MEGDRADNTAADDKGGKARNSKGGHGRPKANRTSDGQEEAGEGGEQRTRGGKERGEKGHSGKGDRRGGKVYREKNTDGAGYEDGIEDTGDTKFKDGGKERGGKSNGKERGGNAGGGNKGRNSKGGNRGEQWDSNAGGDKDRGGRGGRGGGKGHGQARDFGGGRNNDHNAPKVLGNPISAALPHLPAAIGAPARCLLCRTDAPSYMCSGPCGHAEVCWVCIIRLRALSRDNSCPVCKEQASEVLITDDVSQPFPSASALARLPRESSFGLRFANSAIEKDCMRLFEYRSRINGDDVAFKSLDELKNHVWYKHWREFCPTCLDSRTSFISEQLVYSHKCLDWHCRHGDRAGNFGGHDLPSVRPHSWCEFCKKWFFDEDELTRHMHACHHLCQICESQGIRNQFYPNFNCLAFHFADAHYVCPHRDCCHNHLRLTVFATAEELELHRLTVHEDRSQLTDKDKRLRLDITGFRSYRDEREAADRANARAKGKGRGKGNASDFTGVQFCFPETSGVPLNYECDEDVDTGEAEEDRYPDREVFSDHGDEPQLHAEEDEGDDDDSDTDEDDVPALDKRLQNLALQAAVARTGRQEGMLCCLDAIESILAILLPGKPELGANSLQALQSAIGCLNIIEVDTLERVRKDLASCSPDASDWEPLERVLALRPLFFRLLRSAKGGAARTGPIGPIGPKAANAGGRKDEEGSIETEWKTWKFAAQQTVQALGKSEQQWLRAYVHYCIERRAVLSREENSGIVIEQKAELKTTAAAKSVVPVDTDFLRAASADFPSLGGSQDSAGAAVAEVSASTWGKQMKKQAAPTIVPAGPPDAWEDDEVSNFPTLGEQFPSLGGNSSTQSVAKSGWGSAAKASAPQSAPKAAAKSQKAGKASVPTAMDFPSLGGATVGASASSWGVAERERSAAAAKAKLEPRKVEPPKEFSVEESAFPDLPMGAPKAKAGARAAKAKGKAKAKAATKVQDKEDTKRSDVVCEDAKANGTSTLSAEPEDEPVQLVPDDQLILIHDPQDAIARTEAMEAERRAKKAKKPSARKAAVLNPWIARSSSSNS